jgi:hypothetical protein
MKLSALFVSLAFGLAACSTPTPYQPVSASNQSSGGYREQQIETNRWKVEFSGNSLTSRETVERYLLFRAAQLTKLQGYEWFEAADRAVHDNSRYYSDPDPFFSGWGGSYWHMYRGGALWGGGYWGSPGLAPIDIQKVTSYDATIEITMGHGSKPTVADSYAAQDVIDHLQASIRYPSAMT